MTAPFDSSFVFINPFFGAKSVAFTSGANNGLTVNGIDRSQLSPSNAGKLLNRPGNWREWHFLVSTISEPQTDDTFTVADVEWRVDSTNPQGDRYLVLAVSNQRKHR